MNENVSNFLEATHQHQLYFDGLCPLCSKEMALLKMLKSAQLVLVDIHQIAETSKGASELNHDVKEELLRVLHLQLPDGTWLKGLDATVAAWSFTPVKFLWAPLRWKLWKEPLDKFYLRWADKRYCRHYSCALKEKSSSALTNAKHKV